ncbi:MAG: hypothetical protein FJ221_15310 [Lentisphaerae bacterium]|nr:hypothetical protein [Lentisphaerota bacterium]
MKTIIRQMAVFVLVACVAGASEEDDAPITKVELTARTTDSTFGTVVVQAETLQGQDGIGFASLTVTAKGKPMSVPRDVLVQASRAMLTTMTISSEVGYPGQGIGPYLYVCFLGHDGTKPCRFRVVLDANGFKEMKKEDHPAKP